MRIGCLGLGNMGQPMAGKLLDGGHELGSVMSERKHAAASRASGAAATSAKNCDACDTVIVSLPTLEIFRDALSGPTACSQGKP